MTCPRCAKKGTTVALSPDGQVLMPMPAASPIGDLGGRIRTCYSTHQSRLVRCWKCPECGYSRVGGDQREVKVS